MMKRVVALTAGLVLLLLTCACGGGGKDSAPSGGGAAQSAQGAQSGEEAKFVGILFPSAMVDRWPAEAEFLKADLEALGYRAEIQYADENANVQQQQAENFITQGADMLVICAVDTVAAKQIVESAQQEKVAVFSYCRLIEDILYDGYVAEDNNAVGLMQGGYIAEHVPGGNIIVVGGAATDSNGILYREGIIHLVELAAGSRRLCQTARAGNLLSILGSVCGVLLGFYLTFVGSFASLTPVNLLIYMLLWAAPLLPLVWSVDKV